MVVVAQADPPDVQGGAELLVRAGVRVGVGAAEAQAVLDRVQLGEPPRLFRRRDVALDPGLEGPAGTAAALRLGERALGPVPRFVEQPVKHIEIRLFLTYSRAGSGIGLTNRHISW